MPATAVTGMITALAVLKPARPSRNATPSRMLMRRRNTCVILPGIHEDFLRLAYRGCQRRNAVTAEPAAEPGFRVYLAVLVEERGWSKTALSGAAALKSVEVALLGPVLGWMVDRFGSQGIVRAGIVTFGIGFMLLSQTDTLAGFYAAFVVVALGSSMFSNFVVSVTIIQWFEKRRCPCALRAPVRRRNRRRFRVPGCLVDSSLRLAGNGLRFGSHRHPDRLAARAGDRSRPEDHGETVDGLLPAAKDTGHPEASSRRAFSAREAMRTSTFWLLSIGHGFALLVVSAVNVHAITHIRRAWATRSPRPRS